MNPGGTWALVPTRTFHTGKSRLTADRGLVRHRAAICRSLFDGTMRVLSGHDAIAGVLVATDGADVAAAARRAGAEVLMDTTSTLATIIDRGLAQLTELGATAAIVVMADLPLLSASDIGALCEALSRADLVLAPDRNQNGTNALAVRLPALIGTRFGHYDSFARHLAIGSDRRVRTTVTTTRGLGFDVDTPVDLIELAGAAPGLLAHG
jgi:2-phospho-L-lactate guanylyltransferase